MRGGVTENLMKPGKMERGRETRACESNGLANQHRACRQFCTTIHPFYILQNWVVHNLEWGQDTHAQKRKHLPNSPIEAFALSNDSATALCPFTAAQWRGVLPHFIAFSKALGHAISPESSDPCTSVTFTLWCVASGQLSARKSCPRGAMWVTPPKTSRVLKYFTTQKKSVFALHHTCFYIWACVHVCVRLSGHLTLCQAP